MEKITLKPQSCCVCKSSDAVVIAVVPDFEYQSVSGEFTYRRCKTCDHVYLSPLPSVNMLKKLYDRSYYTLNTRSPLFRGGFLYETKLKIDNSRIRNIFKQHKIKTVLDIGCGDLERVVHLKKELRRINVIGMDIAFTKEVSNYAKQQGIELIKGNIESGRGRLKGRTFDIIIMSHVFEHLYHPEKVLRIIRSLMHEDSFCLLETPNCGGLDFILFKRKYWGGYHSPRHFNIFSKKTLISLVERNGLIVVKHGYYLSPAFWVLSIRNKLKLNSVRPKTSFFEFINFKNPLGILLFSFIDALALMLDRETSNQYVILRRRKN